MNNDHDNFVQAINNLRPGAEWALSGDGYENLIWLDTKQTKPTEEEVNAEISTVIQTAPMQALRKMRDVMLAECDWWALTDRQITQAQIEYRQALRDLPKNNPNVAFDANGNLINVNFPIKP